MKIVLIAAGAALALGVLSGTAVSGLRVKGEVMEAHADSVAAALAEDERGAGAMTDDGTVDEGHAAGDTTAAHTTEVEGKDEHTTESDATESDPTESDGTESDGTESDPTESDPTESDPTESDGTEARTSEDLGGNLPSDSGAGDVELGPSLDPGLDVESTGSLEGARKLSKIFGQMKPADAADVLEFMSDEEIVSILRHLSERNSAPILEAFDPARAAALSRILLYSGSTGP